MKFDIDKLRAFLTPVTDEQVRAMRAQEEAEEAAQRAEREAAYRALIERNNPQPTPEELALPDESLFLLFRNEQDVEWTRRRTIACFARDLARSQGGAYVLDEPLEVRVPGWVARRLDAMLCPNTGVPVHAGERALPAELEKYLAKRMLQSEPSPTWKAREGHRAYIVLAADGYCGWSPSGNNLASIVSRALPRAYFGEPLRVELTAGQEARLFAYFDWAADNW